MLIFWAGNLAFSNDIDPKPLVLTGKTSNSSPAILGSLRNHYSNVCAVLSLLPFFFCKASYALISTNSHEVSIDIKPFNVVRSNWPQILNLVISRCCLAEDREKISKSTRHVQHEVSSLCNQYYYCFVYFFTMHTGVRMLTANCHDRCFAKGHDYL